MTLHLDMQVEHAQQTVHLGLNQLNRILRLLELFVVQRKQVVYSVKYGLLGLIIAGAGNILIVRVNDVLVAGPRGIGGLVNGVLRATAVNKLHEMLDYKATVQRVLRNILISHRVYYEP